MITAVTRVVSEADDQKYDEALCISLVQQVNKFVDASMLSQFLRCFLLESNSTSVRWQAHALILHMYRWEQLQDEDHTLSGYILGAWKSLNVLEFEKCILKAMKILENAWNAWYCQNLILVFLSTPIRFYLAAMIFDHIVQNCLSWLCKFLKNGFKRSLKVFKFS